MTSPRKDKNCYWKSGAPSLLILYLVWTAIAFFLRVHILSAFHAHITSEDFFLQRWHSSTNKFANPNIEFVDLDDGFFFPRSFRPSGPGAALEKGHVTGSPRDHQQHGLTFLESPNGTTSTGGHHSSQRIISKRVTSRKTLDPGGTFAKLTRRQSSRSSDNVEVQGPHEIHVDWNGDLDGVDFRHFLRNLTAQQRKHWLTGNLARFKILKSDRFSKAFSLRMRCFFGGSEKVACGYEKSFRGVTVFSDNLHQEDERNKNDDAKDLRFPDEDSRQESTLEAFESGRASAPVRAPEPLRDDGHDPGMSRTNRERKKCGLRVFMTWIYPLSSFGPREQLSVESVFRTYPHACLVVLSRSLDSEVGLQYMKPFLDQGYQIMAASPDVPFLLRNTPALRWFKDLKKGKVDPGEISLGQNLSNLLRLAALYKYGGVYLDSDMIVLQKFPALNHVIGSQSVDHQEGKWTRINNAVMIFSRAHPLVFKFIEEFARLFNGSKWGHNGPYLVTRVWQKLMTRRDYECTVLSPVAFYPVDWLHVGEFFKSPKTGSEIIQHVATMEKLHSESYTLHLWSKKSRDLEVEKGSIVDLIFRQRCVLCDESVLQAALQPQVG